MADPETSGVENASERRNSTRVPFSSALAVSEYDGDSIPPKSDFQNVKAVNLSHTGLSFAASNWPRCDRLIVMMGDPEKPVYVVTRIVGCVKQGKADRGRRVRVHCEFEEWISPSQA